MGMAIKKVQDFIVLPVKFSESSTAHHELFIKRHSVREQTADKPSGRTLFILNVPPYVTETCFKHIFHVAGNVTEVIFCDKPSNKSVVKSSISKYFNPDNSISGFKVAYVVFEKPEGLLKALELKKIEPLSTSDRPIKCGMRKWIDVYNSSIIDRNELRKEIESFTENYDKKVEEESIREKLASEDDDGWVTVTRKGRNPGLPRTEMVESRIRDKERKSNAKKELLNFYTFQIRESKMKHLAGLRKKFEEDKKKIDTLKRSRRFKPF